MTPTSDTARGIPSQFALPHGPMGRFVGWLLARFNARLNRDAVARLAPRPSDRVLEIGFGPGVALLLLLRRVPGGAVAGIDPSSVMFDQASRRNRQGILSGRLELRQGTAADLPWPTGQFDDVLSLNNVFLWNPLEKSFREVHRVLREGGSLVVGLHEWAARGESPPGEGSLPQVTEKLTSVLRSTGFIVGRTEVISVRIGKALLVSAQKPVAGTQAAPATPVSEPETILRTEV